MNIYAYWYQGDLNEFTKNSMEQTKKNNPYLNYKLYDNAMSRTFIKNNFDPVVLECYDILKPKSYKSDLLRHCLLYKLGGIYIDVKLILNPVPQSLFENVDFLIAQGKKRRNFDFKPIETSFLYFKKPGNPRILEVIKEIVRNVKARDKTSHNLLITGPLLVGKKFIGVTPNMKFKATSMPKRSFIYSYKGQNLIDNDLTPYYGNKKHEAYWNMFKSKSGVFYDVVPQENKKFRINIKKKKKAPSTPTQKDVVEPQAPMKSKANDMSIDMSGVRKNLFG